MKNNLYILTEQEFRDTFKLSEGHKIPKETLKMFSNYIKGTQLLFEELSDIRSKPFFAEFKGEKIKFTTNFITKWGCDFQKFVDPLSGDLRMEVVYFEKGYDGQEKTTPFWTYTKFKDEVQDVVDIAYRHFLNNVLLRINSRYNKRFKIKIKYRNLLDIHRRLRYSASDLMEPIFFDGVEFMIPLEVRRPDGIYIYACSYAIEGAILNKSGFACSGRLPEPIKKIIKSFDCKSEN